MLFIREKSCRKICLELRRAYTSSCVVPLHCIIAPLLFSCTGYDSQCSARGRSWVEDRGSKVPTLRTTNLEQTLSTSVLISTMQRIWAVRCTQLAVSLLDGFYIDGWAEADSYFPLGYS